MLDDKLNGKHWIFDLDGTLIDSHPLYISIFEEITRHFKVHLTADGWKDLTHLVLPQFLEKYFAPKDVEPAFNMVIEGNMARHSEIQVYAGVREILDQLRNAGCVLSLCTARERKTAEHVLESTGLRPYFPQFVTRDCVVQTKPHPEGILRLMADAKTPAELTVMVGDHRMDIDAAKSAGIRAVSVAWSEGIREDLSPHSDHHFKNVSDFHRWVIDRLAITSAI